ncbi:hypothetical protein ACH5RR_035193 [Cinchona calisaya]|uniref:GDSL esterase/lipase n=1 Tax=Cinchona calisaya TaxID=153742 RepID=A0ABD2YHJ8_9GENT
MGGKERLERRERLSLLECLRVRYEVSSSVTVRMHKGEVSLWTGGGTWYENLYTANVRKVIVMGLAPLGCAPYYQWMYHSKHGRCTENINDMIMEFNYAMRYVVDELDQELMNTSIIFCDAFEASMNIIKNHGDYGFNVTANACCGLGKYRGWITCLTP